MAIREPQMPAPLRWTKEFYREMDRTGLFNGKRVELIAGEIIEMSPIGSPHFVTTALLNQLLSSLLGDEYFLSIQGPLDVGTDSIPQPDIAVIPGAARNYIDALPATAALIIEVSDSTLVYDRTIKASLYARAMIADYWIVNLRGRMVEVHRLPQQDDQTDLGFSYGSVTRHGEGEQLTPLFSPQSRFTVADLLP